MTAKTVTTSREGINSKNILRIIDKHKDRWGPIIAILEDIQGLFGYLPEKAMRIVADKTGCSLVDIYGVATFYRFFSLEPKGRHLIRVCLGTACHVRGAQGIVEELERQLGIKAGQTTADGELTLETVNCLGACALGPIVVVDGKYTSKVDTAKLSNILKNVRHGISGTETAEQLMSVV